MRESGTGVYLRAKRISNLFFGSKRLICLSGLGLRCFFVRVSPTSGMLLHSFSLTVAN